MNTPSFTGAAHRREWGEDAAEHSYHCDRCGEVMGPMRHSILKLEAGVCNACNGIAEVPGEWADWIDYDNATRRG